MVLLKGVQLKFGFVVKLFEYSVLCRFHDFCSVVLVTCNDKKQYVFH